MHIYFLEGSRIDYRNDMLVVHVCLLMRYIGQIYIGINCDRQSRASHHKPHKTGRNAYCNNR